MKTSSLLTASYIVAWEVISNTDLVEGRGRDIVVGIYPTEAMALEMAKNAGVMGSPAEVRKIKAVKLSDGAQFAIGKPVTDSDAIKKQKIEAALSKLTPEECSLLGLDPIKGGHYSWRHGNE